MTEEEWDAVIKVHLKGTFGPVALRRGLLARAGRRRARPTTAASSTPRRSSGIYGNVGQTNYGAAKAGIAAFTIIAAMELGRYGVTVNAIAPAALTRMTEGLGMGQASDEDRGAHVAALDRPDRHLAGDRPSRPASPGGCSRRRAECSPIAEGWHRGPRVEPVDDPTQLGPVVAELLAEARPNAGMDGEDGWPQTED